jgi:hypothetical protein
LKEVGLQIVEAAEIVAEAHCLHMGDSGYELRD